MLAWRELQDEITRLGGPSSPDTVLHIDLTGRDPDEGATQIPYEKGAALLRLIEQTVGRPALRRVPAIVRRPPRVPVDHDRRVPGGRARASDSRRFGARRRSCGSTTGSTSPGCPTTRSSPARTRWSACGPTRRAFAAGAPASSLKAKANEWSTQEWQYFLGNAARRRCRRSQLADLDRTFGLTRTRQQRDAVCVAAHRHSASLRAGHAGARAVPDDAGAAKVPAAALRGPERPPGERPRRSGSTRARARSTIRSRPRRSIRSCASRGGRGFG